MRNAQLLQFIPGPGEKWASTNKIRLKAKINHYQCQRMLTELWAMDRPLVERIDFGNKRNFYMWKKTVIDKDALAKALKVPAKDRDTGEHKLISRDMYGGLHQYIISIINEIEEKHK